MKCVISPNTPDYKASPIQLELLGKLDDLAEGMKGVLTVVLLSYLLDSPAMKPLQGQTLRQLSNSPLVSAYNTSLAYLSISLDTAPILETSPVIPTKRSVSFFFASSANTF